jgi:glyoxylase I family protein
MGINVSAHHMSFPVSNLERSRQFFESVLGLRSIPRPDMGALKGIWYAAGDCEVHLIEMPSAGDVAPAPAPATPNPLDRHSAFAVADYDETLAHVRSHDLEVVESRRGGQMWVCDPDGHTIELIVPGQRDI